MDRKKVTWVIGRFRPIFGAFGYNSSRTVSPKPCNIKQPLDESTLQPIVPRSYRLLVPNSSFQTPTMSAEKPVLVVLGATGNQGGSVIAHFLSLSPSPYALRAVTRNPSSSKAKSLTSQGVEVVAGDFDDTQSLEAAFSGASIIFSVTDFLQSILNPSLREKAAAAGVSTGFYIRDYETQQNRNIIDAAAKVSTLKRFIYSSLPYANKLSGGKYEHVYYLDSKAAAEEYGKGTYPELWEKTSVLYAGFYLENYLWEAKTVFAPKLVCSRIPFQFEI